MKPFHEIKQPNGRQRIQFFRDGPGRWRYDVLDRDKKRWRVTSAPNAPFTSYAAALIDAQAAMPWISQAIRPHTWHVELLRGHRFTLAEHSEDYGDHHHCVHCWKKLAPPDSESPDSEHRGYVTLYEIPDGSGWNQWNWLCTCCFDDLHQSLQWRISEAGDLLPNERLGSGRKTLP
jgi:hypothetical protein